MTGSGSWGRLVVVDWPSAADGCKPNCCTCTAQLFVTSQSHHLWLWLIGTARTVWEAGSMKWHGVHPSVCPSMGPQQQTCSYICLDRWMRTSYHFIDPAPHIMQAVPIKSNSAHKTSTQYRFTEEIYGVWSRGSQTKRKTNEDLETGCGKNCQARKSNKEDATYHSRWRKLIKDVWRPRWVWVGECFFWYRLTRVDPEKGRLNSCVCAHRNISTVKSV